MARKTYTDWLAELREIVRGNLESELEELPEFDNDDAVSYFKEKSSPSRYFKECLAEHIEGDRIEDILKEIS